MYARRDMYLVCIVSSPVHLAQSNQRKPITSSPSYVRLANMMNGDLFGGCR